MEGKSKLQQRREKIASIKLTLREMPVLKETTQHLEIKLEKNRQAKTGGQFMEKDQTTCKDFDESDLDSSSKYRSLFMDKY
jgi:hypothetical protein